MHSVDLTLERLYFLNEFKAIYCLSCHVDAINNAHFLSTNIKSIS